MGFIALGAPEPPPAAPAPRLLNSWAELDEMMGNYLREVPHTQAQGHSGVVEGKGRGEWLWQQTMSYNVVPAQAFGYSFFPYFFSFWFLVPAIAILWLRCTCAPASAPSPSTPHDRDGCEWESWRSE